MTQTVDEMVQRRHRPDQAKIDKLPVWAREYLERCELTITELEGHFSRITDGFEGTPNQLSVTNYGRRFTFADRDGYMFAWEEKSERAFPREILMRTARNEPGGAALLIQGSDELTIEPRAANSLIIRFVKEAS